MKTIHKIFIIAFILIINIHLYAQEQDSTKMFFASMYPSISDSEDSFIRWCFEGKFKERKFIAKNIKLKYIITTVFQIPYERIIADSNFFDSRYSLEVIVPIDSEKMLRESIQQVIKTCLNICISRENRESKVGVLKKNKNSLLKIKHSYSKHGSYYPGESKIECKAQTMDMFARLLSTSSLNISVFNETKIEGNYDLSIEWKKGDINSLQKSLINLGLILEFDKRPIEFLVIQSNDIKSKNRKK